MEEHNLGDQRFHLVNDYLEVSGQKGELIQGGLLHPWLFASINWISLVARACHFSAPFLTCRPKDG
jgi:hypothetical protein